MKASQLVEGRGIAAREKAADGGRGAIFTNDKGDTIELQNVFFFPPEGGRYENDDKKKVKEPMTGRDKTQSAIADWLEASKIKPHNFKMVNQPSQAAAISVWMKNGAELVAFGRYANAIRPGALGIQWSNSQFASETGYKAGDKVSQTETLPLKPSDLFHGAEKLTLEDILEKSQDLPEDLPEDLKKIIPTMLHAVANGELTYVAGANEYRQAIENYVGEYAAAIALMTGNFLSGDYAAVEEQLLMPQGVSWSDMTLAQFPVSTTTTLIDSYLFSEDQSARVAVSSKSGTGGGAAASLISVVKILQTKESEFNKSLLKRNKELIQGLTVLAENSATDGVYLAGKLYGFVNDKDIKIINYVTKNFYKDEKILTGNLRKLAASYPKRENLQKTISHPNYNLGYRLLASLARKVAKKMNDMNPSEIFRAALAKSSMIQVYASTQKKGDALAFVDFRVVYPPKFEGRIDIDPETNFFSTDKPKGRMTFKIKH